MRSVPLYFFSSIFSHFITCCHPAGYTPVMSELNSFPSVPLPNGKVRCKKQSLRIDFTPMVDLGFLLITFFMLTTLLTQPFVMALVMPEQVDIPDRQAVKASQVLTLIPAANDQLYWYEGLDVGHRDTTDYGSKGLRRVILDKMARVNAQFGTQAYTDTKTNTVQQGSSLYVVVHPSFAARYKNIVDVLDELNICKVRYYVLMPAG